MEQQPGGVRAVFDRALEIESPDERKAYLDEACAGEPERRREVEALLRAHERAGDFLAPPPFPPPAGGGPATASAAPPDVTVGRTEAGPHGGGAAQDLDFLRPSQAPGSLGRLAHYEIQELLGRGGFGIVFRAFDERLHRVVAVKVLGPALAGSDEARKRFLREARSAAAVRNDHVIDIHAVDDRPIPYLVMEYVAGQTLQEKMDRSGPLDLRVVLRIGAQIAEGLAAAHRQGLVHRDVKPANILLENGVERVKITDFGLARAADDASLTQSGVVAGTPMYMAPEQAQGEAIDHRADLFSLGSVLYAMCTGRPAFRGPTSLAVLKRVCEETPPPIRGINSEIPEWLCAIVARLHAKKPQDRFATAKDVADLLAARLSELQRDAATPPPPPSRAVSPLRRRSLWAAAALVLILAVGLILTEATGTTHLTGALAGLFQPAAATPRSGPPTPNAAPEAGKPPPLAVLPFDAEHAAALQDDWAKHLGVPVEIANAAGMKLRLIPPGEFSMTPDYRVRISKPFRLCRCETTVGQFRAFVQATGYKTDAENADEGGGVKFPDGHSESRPEFTWRHPDVAQGDDYPIAQLSWHDAVEFCRWLSRREHRTYRLPTEAEWEWACRAGTTTAYSFGDDAADLGDYAWFDGNSGWKSHPVGLKKPNAWGLFDMHGNVCEYCQDWDADLPSGAVTDPQGPLRGDFRVIRSYSFADDADGLQSDSRAAMTPLGSMAHFGFRVACEVADEAPPGK